jgi:hypothetical protein
MVDIHMFVAQCHVTHPLFVIINPHVCMLAHSVVDRKQEELDRYHLMNNGTLVWCPVMIDPPDFCLS